MTTEAAETIKTIPKPNFRLTANLYLADSEGGYTDSHWSIEELMKEHISCYFEHDYGHIHDDYTEEQNERMNKAFNEVLNEYYDDYTLRGLAEKAADKFDLGAYVKKHKLYHDFINSIHCDLGFSLYCKRKYDVNIENFNAKYDADSATITCKFYSNNLKKRDLENVLISMSESSLEDGIYEACYDDYEGFYVHQPAEIDIRPLNKILEDMGYSGEKLPDTLIYPDVYCGRIDYRWHIDIEPISDSEDADSDSDSDSESGNESK